MPIRDWPLTERPREKLLNQGAQTLSESELIAILLRTGCKGKTAIDLARDLLIHFGSLSALLCANHQDLLAVKGIGLTKIVQLVAGLEIAKRHAVQELMTKTVLNNSEDTERFLMSALRDEQNEVFACLFLNKQLQLIAFEKLFVGTIDSSHVYPREVIKKVLAHNACAIIAAHNHPSGNAEPSHADITITKQLKSALACVEVKLLDHIIVGKNTLVSLAARGIL